MEIYCLTVLEAESQGAGRVDFFLGLWQNLLQAPILGL